MPFGKIPLNDGNEIPAIAYGTGTALKGKDAAPYVHQAIECGFSHIDTAQAYHNEESVGVAIRENGLSRDELYVTTKYARGNIQEAVRESLAKLGLKQLDLYLIHNPLSVDGRFVEAWREFEKIKDAGLTRSIGVSNFTVEQLREIVDAANVKPAVNQIQFHPYVYAQNKPLLDYAAKHGIIIEAYSSLSPITHYPGGPVDLPMQRAAKRLGVGPTQVLLAWAKAKGVVIVTTSFTKSHLEEYLAVGDIELTPEEVAQIDAAGTQGSPSALTVTLHRARKRVVLSVVLGALAFVGWRLLQSVYFSARA